MASLIEHLSDQGAARASCPSSLLWGSVTELVLHAVPCPAIENCLVLPGIAGALVRDLADVDRIRLMFAKIGLFVVNDLAPIGAVLQHQVERPAREWLPTGTGPIAVNTLLRSDPLLIEVLLEQSHRAELPVAAKDQPHGLGLLGDGDQLAILGRIAERGEPAYRARQHEHV